MARSRRHLLSGSPLIQAIGIRIYRDIESNPAYLQHAEEYGRRALALDPELAEAHVAIGQVYADKFDYSAAAGEFRKASELDPDNGFAFDQLSWSLAYAHPPDAIGAEAAARKAIRLEPSSIFPYYHLGRALLLQKRYDDALAAFAKVQQISPHATLGTLGMGQAYLAKGDYDEAIKSMTTDFNPSNIAYYWLGAAYAAKRDRAKALETMQQAFKGGFTDFAAIDNSPYFDSIRSDTQFQAMLSKYRK